MGLKPYGCGDYREEMMLVGLKRQLADPDLDEAARHRLEEQVRLLEARIGLD